MGSERRVVWPARHRRNRKLSVGVSPRRLRLRLALRWSQGAIVPIRAPPSHRARGALDARFGQELLIVVPEVQDLAQSATRGRQVQRVTGIPAEHGSALWREHLQLDPTGPAGTAADRSPIQPGGQLY